MPIRRQQWSPLRHLPRASTLIRQRQSPLCSQPQAQMPHQRQPAPFPRLPPNAHLIRPVQTASKPVAQVRAASVSLDTPVQVSVEIMSFVTPWRLALSILIVTQAVSVLRTRAVTPRQRNNRAFVWQCSVAIRVQSWLGWQERRSGLFQGVILPPTEDTENGKPQNHLIRVSRLDLIWRKNDIRRRKWYKEEVVVIFQNMKPMLVYQFEVDWALFSCWRRRELSGTLCRSFTYGLSSSKSEEEKPCQAVSSICIVYNKGSRNWIGLPHDQIVVYDLAEMFPWRST